jgi:AcrR family transcriptional regulator
MLPCLSLKTIATEPRLYHHGDLRRTLIDAALALVTEEQDWSFSLREVARRAGVSHNAPYNHFTEKRDLLGAVAAVGFEMLCSRMLDALGKIRRADTALKAVAQAYVGFAAENPALYRLMFGPALAEGNLPRPETAQAAGAKAKAVLEDIILRGARSGLFTIAPENQPALAMATLACWSAVHGLAMLVIDAKAEAVQPLTNLVDGLIQFFLNGLQRAAT